MRCFLFLTAELFCYATHPKRCTKIAFSWYICLWFLRFLRPIRSVKKRKCNFNCESVECEIYSWPIEAKISRTNLVYKCIAYKILTVSNQTKMLRKLTLLLIFALSTTVLSLDNDVADAVAQALCTLAYGAKDSTDLVDVLGTKCKTNCNGRAKTIKFVCDNYEGKFTLDFRLEI